MAPASRKKLRADLANLKARLAATRSERDLMKAVSDELHSKVLDLETQLNGPVAGQSVDAGLRIMPAEGAANAAELAEAVARAERLAERVAELRLQLSVFAPDSREAAARAGETLARARQTTERVQTLERQLATARAREDELVSQGVRNEAVIADFEARVLELSGLEARFMEVEIARADAEEALMEMQRELLTLRIEVERLKKDRDEARGRAEAERALAAADRLRADEAQRMVEARVLGQQAPAAAIDDTELIVLTDERDDLQAMLSVAQARLGALEEVAAHAAVLESEMADARARMPEMKIAADAAARRAAELSEALHMAESERDALRSALEARLRAMPAEEAASEDAVQNVSADEQQEELQRSGTAVASIWLSEGVGGGVEAVVDLTDTVTGLGPEPVSSGDDDASELSETSSDAFSDASGQAHLRKRGRSLRRHPPEDPTSWT
jgi:chromosome segregation ATPase